MSLFVHGWILTSLAHACPQNSKSTLCCLQEGSAESSKSSVQSPLVARQCPPGTCRFKLSIPLSKFAFFPPLISSRPDKAAYLNTNELLHELSRSTHAHPHKQTNVRSAGWLCMGLTRLTSRLMGYHPSQSILPKVSVCERAAHRATETANLREPQRWGQGSEVTPVPTVAEGACLCSLSPHQHTHAVWPPWIIETE